MGREQRREKELKHKFAAHRPREKSIQTKVKKKKKMKQTQSVHYNCLKYYNNKHNFKLKRLKPHTHTNNYLVQRFAKKIFVVII